MKEQKSLISMWVTISLFSSLPLAAWVYAHLKYPDDKHIVNKKESCNCEKYGDVYRNNLKRKINNPRTIQL